MSREVAVFNGKASANALENLHGKVAGVYSAGLNDILERHTEEVEKAEQLSEAEGQDFKKPRFNLSKEDIALLKGAQSFLKENDIQVDVISSKGGKSLRKHLGAIIDNN